LALSTDQEQKIGRETYKKLRKDLLTKTGGNHSDDCTVNLERTLDEAYYPGLSPEDLKKRNKDQVIYRESLTHSISGKGTLILMAPQLWLWRIGGTIVTAYSMSSQSKIFPPWRYTRKGGHVVGLSMPRIVTSDPDEHMGLILADQIEMFGEQRDSEEMFGNESNSTSIKYPAPLDIFETSVVSVLSDVNSYMKATKPSEVDYIKEHTFLHNLSDIRSELAMIQNILEQQKEILDSLLNDRPKAAPAAKDDSSIADAIDRLITERLRDRLPTAAEAASAPTTATATGVRPSSRLPPEPARVGAWVKVEKAQNTLVQYQRRVLKIDGDAERVQKAVQDKLDLKRTYASVKDAHSSLLLSTAVIGFTVVTIVFAPLAFLTALFALNIDGFDLLQLKGRDGVYSSGKMSAIFGRRCVVFLLFGRDANLC
jgi:hypothetical protein